MTWPRRSIDSQGDVITPQCRGRSVSHAPPGHVQATVDVCHHVMCREVVVAVGWFGRSVQDVGQPLIMCHVTIHVKDMPLEVMPWSITSGD